MKVEELLKVNSELPTVNIRGKEYVMVKDRVAAFRKICPNGSIETKVLSMDNGTIIMQAIVKDGDVILATGTAWEKESNGYINKTSYVENCETSCIGRALGFAGIGIDDSMASGEEVANAILNQGKSRITEEMVKHIIAACQRDGIHPEAICSKYGVSDLKDIPLDIWTKRVSGKKTLEEWAVEGAGKAG